MERERNQALCHNSLVDKDSWTTAAAAWGEILAPLPPSLGLCSALVMLKPQDFFLRSSERHLCLTLALSNENKPILVLVLAYERLSAWVGGHWFFFSQLDACDCWHLNKSEVVHPHPKLWHPQQLWLKWSPPKKIQSMTPSLLLWLCPC